jgi:membrane associated rhomboid family serine protease
LFPLKDNLVRPGVPWVTVVLIALNFAVFGWQQLQPSDRASTPELARAGVSERDQVTLEYGAIPFRITHPGSECGVAVAGATQEVICEGAPRPEAFPQEGYPDDLEMAPWWLTLLTSLFLQTSFLALAVNMLALWIFGNTIETAMGRWRFLLFYLAAGVVALYGQAALDPHATLPIVGAGGAVAGVLGAYALRYWKAKVLTFVITIPLFFTFIEIPSLVLIGIWFGLQFLPGFSGIAELDLADDKHIAYFGHVAGFLFGLAAVRLLVRRDGQAPELEG